MYKRTKKLKLRIFFIIFIFIIIFSIFLVLNSRTQKSLTILSAKSQVNSLLQETVVKSWEISNESIKSTTATLYTDGRLVITGTGEMKSWSKDVKTDFHTEEFAEKIKNVIIENGVPTIGRYAFANLPNLTSVEIPESITRIGSPEIEIFHSEAEEEIEKEKENNNLVNTVFSNCKSLTNINVNSNNAKYKSIEGVLLNKDENKLYCYPQGKAQTTYTIPSTVEIVHRYAFSDAIKLNNITISEGVQEIEAFAFKNCTGITQIDIPSSVKKIGLTIANYSDKLSNPFYGIDSGEALTFLGCENLQSITVNGSNLKYSSENGILFNKEKTEIAYYPSGKPETSYTIGNNVKRIHGYCFINCKNLTNIIMSEGLQEIEGNAFQNCIGLTSVNIPKTVTSIKIGMGNFIESVLHNYPFIGCSNLNNITVDNENTEYSSEKGVLFNKDKSKIVYYPEGKKEASYVIPNSVTIIGTQMFLNCENIKKIVVPSSVTDCSGILLAKIVSELDSIILQDLLGEKSIIECEKINTTIYCKKDSAIEQYCKENKIEYVIDETVPTIKSITKDPSNWTNQSIKLTVDAEDTESGIAENNAYSFDNGENWQNENYKIYNGNVDIIIKVKDNLNNITTSNQIKIDKIDKIVPTIEISPNGASASKSKNVKITTADAGGSGLSNNNSYQYQLGKSKTEVPTGTWQNYISGTEFTIGENLTGEYYLWVKNIKDNAGNKSTNAEYIVSNKFIFDNEKNPEISPSTHTTYNVEIVGNDKQTIQKGQTVEIKIKVKDIVNMVDGVARFSAKLEYDTTKLEKVGAGEGLNGFLLVGGDTIELTKYPGITSETEIAKFTFKCIEAGEAQIKLTNVEVANGTDNFKLGKDITKSISIVSSNNVVNDNDDNNNDNDADSGNNENNSNNGNNASDVNNGSDENSKESTPEDTKVFPKTGININTTILISFCLIMGIVATISFVKIKKFAKIK